MCWYTDFLFVNSIKYYFKYLLSTYYRFSLKINCGLGEYIDISPDFILIKHDYCELIYFNINLYENKIGYYKHIYFYIIHHENKLGYYKHRYFILSYFMKIN
jgi:hypothetical protein